MSFCLMLKIKEDILKNADNPTVDVPHSLIYYLFPYMEVNGDQQLFGFSKYIILCST